MNIELKKTPTLLDKYPIGITRRNHGLEHATLHILAHRQPRQAFAGHSDPGGFWIIGKATTSEVRSAVDEALQRLRNGERSLAIHPNCGTNLVTSGVLAGLAGVLAMSGVGQKRLDKLERLPVVISLATLSLLVAQPLGLFLQSRLTTSGEPGSLEVVKISTSPRGRLFAHRIVTQET